MYHKNSLLRPTLKKRFADIHPGLCQPNCSIIVLPAIRWKLNASLKTEALCILQTGKHVLWFHLRFRLFSTTTTNSVVLQSPPPKSNETREAVDIMRGTCRHACHIPTSAPTASQIAHYQHALRRRGGSGDHRVPGELRRSTWMVFRVVRLSSVRRVGVGVASSASSSSSVSRIHRRGWKLWSMTRAPSSRGFLMPLPSIHSLHTRRNRTKSERAARRSRSVCPSAAGARDCWGHPIHGRTGRGRAW
jgi:hypothetical protein